MSRKEDLSIDDKKKLNSERKKAVRDAWTKEKEYVSQGIGTRDWSPEQQHQIMEECRVQDYEGHHMKSVSEYPEYAGSAENIQFLSKDEHFMGAHQGNYHNQTNGYYNPGTEQMEEFKGSELKAVETRELSFPCYENGKRIHLSQSASEFGSNIKNTGKESEKGLKDSKSIDKTKEMNKSENQSQSNQHDSGISR